MDGISWIAICAVILLVAKVLAMIVAAFESADSYSDRNATLAFEPLVKPSWATFFAAVSTAMYGLATPVIQVEVMSEMRNPQEIFWALKVILVYVTVLYLLVGVFLAVLWGSDIAYPVVEPPTYCGETVCPDSPAGLQPGGISAFVAVSVIVATASDYLVAAAILSNSWLSILDKHSLFDHKYDIFMHPLSWPPVPTSHALAI